ncbi:phasin family protein [uncultured Tateyamaria sp.]|uniref:phasin family protein n=1 Tax=uncultured Tateyamaria sp. TaxID=455651 RepID=UPI0026110E9B|nr:phasin family protein [uncultured Tateyamaria sp.]
MPTKDPSKTLGTVPLTEDNPATRMASDAAALQDQGLKAMSQFGMAWAEGLSNMGSEVLSFVADRIKEDVATQHKLLHCKDVADFQQIQSEFMQKAIDQYTAETGKLVQMSQELYPNTVGEDDKAN